MTYFFIFSPEGHLQESCKSYSSGQRTCEREVYGPDCSLVHRRDLTPEQRKEVEFCEEATRQMIKDAGE